MRIHLSSDEPRRATVALSDSQSMLDICILLPIADSVSENRYMRGIYHRL